MRKVNAQINASNESSESGMILFPLILSLLLIFGGSLSLLVLRMKWRKEVIEQRRLDQCVQKTAIKLINIQNSIESSNLRMKAARIAAMSPIPYLKQAAQAELLLEFGIQEFQKICWIKEQSVWILKRGCDSRKDILTPLTSLKWARDPPDKTGPKPLHWTGTFPDKIKIFITNGKRVSYAEIEGKQQLSHSVWSADWQSWTGSY